VGIPSRVLLYVLCLGVASSGGCSSHEQHPAQIGDCKGPAGVCLNSGVVGSGSGNADGGGCGTLTFVEPCQTCVETNCCSLVGLCSDNADCLSLVDCAASCHTQSCLTDCKTKLPNGVAGFDALDQCVVSSCSIECSPSDAGTNDAGTSLGQSCGRLAYQSVACENCVESSCCDQAEMCSSDPECFLYLQCLANCTSTDTKCRTDCQTSNPLGYTNSAHLGQCIQEKCSTPCQ
jgi:hypothetical protein